MREVGVGVIRCRILKGLVFSSIFFLCGRGGC